jgi:tetratricopeptide (TPR) repeat protein
VGAAAEVGLAQGRWRMRIREANVRGRRWKDVMRSDVTILAASLALTVFLTSLVLEHSGQGSRKGTIGAGGSASPPTSLLRSCRPGAEGATPALPAGAGEIAEMVAQGWRFYDAGNAEGAIEILKAALAKAPEDSAVNAALGVISFAGGHYAEAETRLQRHLAAEPGDTDCRVRLGMAQLRQCKYGPALANMRVALAEEPRAGALHFALACIHARLADRDRALYHLERAYAELGVTLLAHISDANLDSLRDTPKFRAIVAAALGEYRRRTSAPPATPVAADTGR